MGWPSAPYGLGEVVNAQVLRKKFRKFFLLLKKTVSATTAKHSTVKSVNVLSNRTKTRPKDMFEEHNT